MHITLQKYRSMSSLCRCVLFFASYFCKNERVYSISCWFITIHWQTVYCIALVALNFKTKWNSCIVVCIPRSIMKNQLLFMNLRKKHVFQCILFMIFGTCFFIRLDLVYTTGGPPDFIVMLLIICYHWNLIRLFRTVLTETYDLRKSYQCAIFITTVSKEHRLIYSWLW